MRRRPERARRAGAISATRVGPEHAVVSLRGDGPERFRHRREVCAECPWRTDVEPGEFPAEAFRRSALTAYDMSTSSFACHMSTGTAAAACAGFLLSQGGHNLAVRIAIHRGLLDPAALRRTAPLHPNYRAVAIANGVDPEDPVLALCRDDGALL